MSLFQLAHANEVPDGNMCEYEIKHYFLRARDLHHAHVYVTLYGHQITPGFYEDTIEDMPETYHEYAKKAADERNLEMYETMNEECSKGEHFWHSIKKVDQEKYDGQVIKVSTGDGQLFKLSVQFCTPCKNEFTEENFDKYNQYQMEQKKNIFQLRAQNEDLVLKYIYQNLEKFDLRLEQLPVNGEKITKWKDIQELFEKETNCLGDGHRHGEFVVLKLEILSEPIGIIDCDD